LAPNKFPPGRQIGTNRHQSPYTGTESPALFPALFAVCSWPSKATNVDFTQWSQSARCLANFAPAPVRLARSSKCLAHLSKCSARTDRSGTRAEATNKREISQSSLVGNGGCAVSGCQSAGKRCTTHYLGNWTTPNMSMAATNKSLARNDKSRTWVEPTKKRRTSRHGDSAD